MSARRKKGKSPVTAVVLLVAGLLVAGRALLPTAAPETAPAPMDDDDYEDPAESMASAVAAVEWRDLLAAHGSYRDGVAVRAGFSILQEARSAMPAPAGEVAADAGAWRGADPPALVLGVLMVSARSRRAVVDGRVVGVGEEHAGVRIEQVERDHVLVSWGARFLTYDFEDPWPREFRSERARRASAATGDDPLEETR